MVGSSLSEAERRAWNRVLGLGVVLVVGTSSALLAFAGGATLPEIAAVTAVGGATGALLVWYLSTLTVERDREYRRR